MADAKNGVAPLQILEARAVGAGKAPTLPAKIEKDTPSIRRPLTPLPLALE